MSIEQAIAEQTAAIKANTDAMERLMVMLGNGAAIATAPTQAATGTAPVAPAQPAQAAAATPAAPSANQAPAPAPAAVAPAPASPNAAVPPVATTEQVAMTDEQIDKAVMDHVVRLGNTNGAVAQVRAVMQQMGLQTVKNMNAAQQQQLLEALTVLQPETAA